MGAFVEGPAVLARGVPGGPLSGRTFAVKDVIAVAGRPTGAGNPAYPTWSSPAPRHAAAVSRLLAAGADLLGRTHTDELAWSLSGTNAHLGTPRNPAAPGRAPGGSSSGSAAAVAAGLVDVALGTDTGGSIRVPASSCGLLGLRPTHGRVDARGVVPLAPTFDTVGVLARHPGDLRATFSALVGAAGSAAYPTVADRPCIEETRPTPVLRVCPELLEGCEPGCAEVVLDAAHRIADLLGVSVEERPLGGAAVLERWAAAFRVLQGAQVVAVHGPWLRTRPPLGPGVAARAAAAARVTPPDVGAAAAVRVEATAALSALLSDGGVLVAPATPGPAHRLDLGEDARAVLRRRTLALTAPASLAGVPSVVLPTAGVGGLPLGVALLAAPGGDERLLTIAALIDARG